MRIIHGIENIDPPLAQSVLTIGNFDGVHRAHQQLLAQAGLFAANTGGPVVVLTFEPHPLSIVAPERAPERLSGLDEKLRLLEGAGADIVVVAVSEPSLMALEAERFFHDVVQDRFHPTHIVEGPSFGFGKGRKGTPELLSRLASETGCAAHILEPMTVRIDDGQDLLVSSSMIRTLIRAGKVRRASFCLGRPYAVIGEVVEGARRGRTIGFPTANLHVEDVLVPGDGVFVGRSVVRGKTLPCAISIGNKPTFGGTGRCIEAHLLDYTGDLYGETMRLEFIRRLRQQMTFDGPDALMSQLARDVETVRREVDHGRAGA